LCRYFWECIFRSEKGGCDRFEREPTEMKCKYICKIGKTKETCKAVDKKCEKGGCRHYVILCKSDVQCCYEDGCELKEGE